MQSATESETLPDCENLRKRSLAQVERHGDHKTTKRQNSVSRASRVTKLTELAKRKSNASDIWIEVMKESAEKFVVCLNNKDYPASLELHKIYRLVPDEEAESDGDLRVIDESGEDYLYPADFFAEIELPLKIEQSLLKAA